MSTRATFLPQTAAQNRSQNASQHHLPSAVGKIHINQDLHSSLGTALLSQNELAAVRGGRLMCLYSALCTALPNTLPARTYSVLTSKQEKCSGPISVSQQATTISSSASHCSINIKPVSRWLRPPRYLGAGSAQSSSLPQRLLGEA